MYLRSLALKGFKSFPDRTRLDFGPGVSVVVGPNGSGKSNITDSILWAMGEQSPLAVRGQSMQDVIFAGAAGQKARGSAEVEVVIDNSDGSIPLDFTEVSVLRRLDRTGEGEYRINGSRCRLTDVIELLSETGLGKEMHSVVSQGRVEAVVSSKPRDRRMLIEEAAGLGKHRKRRRRAQLKLQRTQDNLDRALDVEREARSRLRPLKRQAEAAELHERLERQSLEARWQLAREDARVARAALADAESQAQSARSGREEVQAALTEVAARREQAEEALTARGERREELSGRVFAVRAARERIELRLEQARAAAADVSQRIADSGRRVERLEEAVGEDGPEAGGTVAELERELAALAGEESADAELAGLERRRTEAQALVAAREAELVESRRALDEAEWRCEEVRQERRAAERALEAERADHARLRAEIAACEQFLSTRTGAAGAPALADELDVEPGYELAVAAALGGRLGAAVVADLAAGTRLLDQAGPDGGRALVRGRRAGESMSAPPGAEPLAGRVRGDGPGAELARELLSASFLVDDIDGLSDDFTGTAVTRSGRAWFGASHELRQAPEGGVQRVLAERNRRERLLEDAGAAAGREREGEKRMTEAAAAVEAADSAREEAEAATRAASRARDEAAEAARRAAWLVEQRREAPSPAALRRLELEAQIGAERRVEDRAARERRERAERLDAERARLAVDRELAPAIARLVAALEACGEAIDGVAAGLEGELEADRSAGDRLASDLRECAREEAELQARLHGRGEAVTTAEVAAQQVRDRAAEAEAELGRLAERLELEPEPAEEALADEERERLEAQIARLARRREQLGPVNPLAKDEYAEAREHVDELERQRRDMEGALRELQSLIADTDRMIKEAFEQTFEAAARNFEEVVEQLFPGGRGRLRLVEDEVGPRPVLGGAEEAEGQSAESAGAEEEGDEGGEPEDRVGVEIEITPAGKSMKRLSLLSGGEKSMTALAFLFAIFLARPCPFYVLDEVEAALDDLNLDRFITLLRRYSGRAQFIVVTHQKRTMEAADALYGVSMGDDGISRVVSRRLPREDAAAA